MTQSNGTHKIVCRNPKAEACLMRESILIGISARKGKYMSQGDAMVGRDILYEHGFLWQRDFYIIKKVR